MGPEGFETVSQFFSWGLSRGPVIVTPGERGVGTFSVQALRVLQEKMFLMSLISTE